MMALHVEADRHLRKRVRESSMTSSPASKRRINSSSAISSPDIARGDHRSSSSGSMGKSAVRISLPLIMSGCTVTDGEPSCDWPRTNDWRFCPISNEDLSYAKHQLDH